MQQEKFDSKEAEKKEISSLKDQGEQIFIGKKQYTIKQPFYGTLIYMCEELIELHYEESLLTSQKFDDWFNEGKRMLHADARRMARIVAIAILRDEWKLKFLLPYYTNKILWSMTTKDMLAITAKIIQIDDIANFIGSTKYLSIKKRLTTPKTVETEVQEEE